MKNMMAFTGYSKMADVIHKNYRLIPIITRFGIKLGFGNRSVYEICQAEKVDIDFFLGIINFYHSPSCFSKSQIPDFRADVFVEYLLNVHAYYLNSKIPQIELCIHKMEQEVVKENIRNIGLLRDFFQEYKTEIEEHFKIEREKVFPYILSLEEVLNDGECSDELVERIRKDPIEIYKRNYESLEVKLGDMKNLIIRFLPPVLCKDLCERLLIELFRMESDLEDHARIEKKILIPKMKLLEQKVLEVYGIF